jgi:GntR family transcriptional repressor for pyruvate dehydrogenase complex
MTLSNAESLNKKKHIGFPAKKIRAIGKCDMVVEAVINMIANNVYQAGDKLPAEQMLADNFGVSRISIREAFKKLSLMGFISVRQGEGTFVRKVTPSTFMDQLFPLMLMEKDHIEEIYDARICIEAGIAELAAKNRTDEEISVLEAMLGPMAECVTTQNFERYNELDEEFHAYIGELCKNHVLASINRMLGRVRKHNIHRSNNSMDSIEYSLQKHKEIVEAIKSRDVANIVSIMKLHITFSKKKSLAQFEG